MAALPSAPFLALFASSWFVLCQGTKELKVKPGEDATLQCRSDRGADITMIKWSRSDLKSDDGFVFYLSPEATNGEYQNPLFQGRVELQDPEMKNGDASVILKKVKTTDNGTYECSIVARNLRRRQRAASQLINTIRLTVTGGDKEGNVGLMVGLPVFAVLLVAVAVVGTMIFKKRRENTAHPGGEADSLNSRPSG